MKFFSHVAQKLIFESAISFKRSHTHQQSLTFTSTPFMPAYSELYQALAVFPFTIWQKSQSLHLMGMLVTAPSSTL